jgi:hypothetical protein
MQQEMDSIEYNRTWELVDLPAGHRSVTLKQRFQVVPLAGRAGRATSRLITIRTTTRMINRVLVVWSFT